MTYELAKKLKDAGFPYRKSLFAGLTDESYLDSKGETINIPSLFELIKACGDNFSWLKKSYQADGFGKWCAGHIQTMYEPFWGDTPEEAIANLWLELQKHA